MKNLSLFLFLAVLLLFGIGFVTLTSASAMYASILREGQFSMSLPQLVWGTGFLVLAYILSLFDYRVLRKFALAGIILCVVLLVWTRFASPPLNKVHRWFIIGHEALFQTADVAKLLLFVFIAEMVHSKGERMKELREYGSLLIVVVVVAGLVVIQPSISNTILILSVSIAMLFVGGARWQHVLSTLAILGVGMYGVVNEVSYAADRWAKYIKGLRTGIYDDQVMQALIGLGSGGWVGRGIGNSQQRNLHLPEAYGDFIFAIAGEEYGFLGTVVILLLYFTIFWMGLLIARRALDQFGRVLAFGISFSFLMHGIIHVAVSVGLLPNTGIPLLFVSHGRTSLLVTSISVAILMSISTQAYRAELEAAAAKEAV